MAAFSFRAVITVLLLGVQFEQSLVLARVFLLMAACCKRRGTVSDIPCS
jgi:hypothetical protein